MVWPSLSVSAKWEDNFSSTKDKVVPTFVATFVIRVRTNRSLPDERSIQGLEMTKTEPVKWDRHAIKAEIGRKGLTMEAIAEKAGLQSWRIRQGLRGNSKIGAQAIAKALDVPFRTLFPDSYVRGTNKAQPIQNSTEGASPKANAPTDRRQRVG